MLVTARPPRWLDPLAAIVGGHGLAICTNGAFLYDVGARTVIRQQGLSKPQTLAIADRLRMAMPGVGLAVELADGFHREPGYPDPHGERLPGMPWAPLRELADDAVVGELLAAEPGPSRPEFIDAVTEVIGDLGVVAFSGVGALAEISAPGVTKGAALARWCEERGIDRAEVWAFGDMPNDLPMLTWAGRSFAVEGGHPDVVAAATDVCPSNADDGVAQILEQL